MHDELERRISGVATLDQPLRRRLYRWLAERGGWQSRDDAAAAVDVARSVAAFHLDKLADAGLAEVTFERTSGRTGPGAGRPSKLYRRSQHEVSASIPDRRYDLAAALLARAVERSSGGAGPVDACLAEVAAAEGRSIGEGADPGAGAPLDRVAATIGGHGYEPCVFDGDGDGEGDEDGDELALANCPFHRLAQAHRSLVCGMNLALLTGLLEGMELDRDLTARLQPVEGWCCVRIGPRR